MHFDSPAFDDSLHYKVPEKLLAVHPPPRPSESGRAMDSDPKGNSSTHGATGRWTRRSKGLEKQILSDGPGSRVIRVTGDFGEGSSLNYNFGNGAKLDRGRYRFVFRVRGTPGQSVEFELADGWRGVSKEARIPLTEQWQEHIVEFEIKNTFQDETTLRFSLPHDAKGTFDLANTRLKAVK